MSASSDGRTANLIAQQAEAHGASVLTHKGSMLLVALRLQRNSGRIIPYHLRIEVYGDYVSVREEKPLRLPTFCPNRHINPGGGFCLGYSQAEPQRIDDEEGAVAWWRRVLKFLTLQEAARKLRRWPSTVEWAHGSAAMHQMRAEACAQALGPRFVEALGRRRLTVLRRRNAPAFLTLNEGGARLYSMWAETRRVATQRQRCFCGSGRALACCGDHAASAAGLVQAIADWESAEKRFWKSVREETCCGTMPDCPMKKAPAPAAVTALAA